MNKQIEEHIAVIEIEKELCGKPCDICKANNNHCMPHRMAKKLAAKGWRKASDVVRDIINDILEGLQFEIYNEDKLGRNAWEESDTVGYHIHQYAEEKLDTIKIALSLYQKKYTEGKNESGT